MSRLGFYRFLADLGGPFKKLSGYLWTNKNVETSRVSSGFRGIPSISWTRVHVAFKFAFVAARTWMRVKTWRTAPETVAETVQPGRPAK